jgi:hypothetical protein
MVCFALRRSSDVHATPAGWALDKFYCANWMKKIKQDVNHQVAFHLTKSDEDLKKNRSFHRFSWCFFRRRSIDVLLNRMVSVG